MQQRAWRKKALYRRREDCLSRQQIPCEISAAVADAEVDARRAEEIARAPKTSRRKCIRAARRVKPAHWVYRGTIRTEESKGSSMRATIGRMLDWRRRLGAVEPGCVVGVYRATDAPISAPGLRLFRTHPDGEWIIAGPT